MSCVMGRTQFVLSLVAMLATTVSPASSASDDTQFSILLDTDAPGSDYKRFDPPSFSSCQERCAAETACRAFSYNVTKQVCFLKTRGDIQLIPHREGITGVKAAATSSAAQSSNSSGTGFAVSADGAILTNRHVVDQCKVIAVEGWGTATVKAVDQSNDLALLKVEGNPSPVTFRAAPINIGDTVFVTGYPYGGLLGSGLHFTNGLVSSTTGIENDSRFLQITAPVQPGNSGGPLLDERGQVVGVVAGRLNDIAVLKASGSLPQNVNFAIHGGLATTFLRANDVEPLTSSSPDVLSPSEIAKNAKLHTFRLNCLSGTQ
jgi:S1-C subfamily serine protease